MKNRQQPMLKILNEMRKYKNAVNENYYQEDEEPEIMDSNAMEDDDYQNMEINHSRMQDDDNSIIDLDDNEVVNQLRKLALKGIQKYSEDVSNPLYEFYKKIWAECDKLITDSVKKKEIGGKK